MADDEVDLSQHKLVHLPEDLRGFTQLRALTVSSTALEELPPWLGDLSSLAVLNLLECTSLTALPAEIGELKGLETLNLEGCTGLTAVPDELEGLVKLEHLNLRLCSRVQACLLYTSPSPRDQRGARMPSSA